MSAVEAHPLQGWFDRLAGEDIPSGFPLNSMSSQLESVRTVKAGAGTLFGFSGFNSKAATQFILVFDSSSALVAGQVPVIVITAAATSNFSYAAPPLLGRSFRAGIIIANSSTSATLTAGSSDCWYDAQYA